MNGKICPVCNDGVSTSEPEAKKFSEDGRPPCYDCFVELQEARLCSEEQELAND